VSNVNRIAVIPYTEEVSGLIAKEAVKSIRAGVSKGDTEVIFPEASVHLCTNPTLYDALQKQYTGNSKAWVLCPENPCKEQATDHPKLATLRLRKGKGLWTLMVTNESGVLFSPAAMHIVRGGVPMG
jgi:hypothetical protein